MEIIVVIVNTETKEAYRADIHLDISDSDFEKSCWELRGIGIKEVGYITKTPDFGKTCVKKPS